jgi:hypothetical protein
MKSDLKVEIDITGLNNFNSQLLGVLIGTGQGGDATMLVRTEAGQLANEIQGLLGPKTKSKADAAVKNNVQTFLNSDWSDRAGRKKYSTFTTEGQTESNHNGFRWLTAGPNWVLGIKDEDYQLGMSADVALKNYTKQKTQHGRGKAYIELGTRSAKEGKHQHLLMLNRTRVTKATFTGVVKAITQKVGQSRAAFAYAATQLMPGKSYPSWISKHFPGVDGKAIFVDSKSAEFPTVTIGSRAKGVNSNPYIVDKIARAVEARKRIMASKIKNILKGYSYNWKTGQTFRPQVPAGGLP